jgi:hypothetical protein
MPALTVTVIVPLLLPKVAVIVADPTPTAVTRPLDETITFAGLELDHVTVPLTVFPPASLSAAVNCCVCPTASVTEVGEIVTVATAPTVGVMVCVAEVSPVAANVRV